MRTLLLLLLVGCARSPEPVRAAPPTPTVVAFGSCDDQRRSQDHWDAIAAVHPELFVFAGDDVYADVEEDAQGFRLLPPDEARLRAAWATLGADPSFRRFRAAVPILPGWDDHDYGQNDGGADMPIREASQRAFLEFWEVPPDDPRWTRPGTYTATTLGPPGRRVQVVLLDTRSFRSPLLRATEKGPGREVYQPDPDPTKTMLGDAQWRWLDAVLAEPAEVRLVVSSIQVLTDAHGFERWGNLPAERDRLVERLGRADGVVILSGDRHVGGIYRQDVGAPYPLIELTSSALNKAFGGREEPDPLRVGDLVAGENFGTVTVDWAARSVGLRLHDVDGPAGSGAVVRELVVPLDALHPAR